MNRSPRPLRRWPPAPRSPSSSSAPVMSEPGMTRPVGWNCTISMSRSERPARYASAMPSADLSAEQAMTRYIVGPPPIASSVARARATMNLPRRMSSSRAPAARPASSSSSSTARTSSSAAPPAPRISTSVSRVSIIGPRSLPQQPLQQGAPGLRGPRLGAQGLGDQRAVAADEEHGRRGGDAVGAADIAFGVEEQRHGQALVLRPGADLAGALLDADGQHHEPAVAVVLVHLLDGRGQLPRAVRSPGRPEVEHDRPAAVLGQRHLLAIAQALELERGRRLAVEGDELEVE